MKRLLRVEWAAIAGIVAALAALIMHFLHILEIQDLWQQEVWPKVDACLGKAKVREPHWASIHENVSLILSDTGPAGSTECLMSFWGEPFMAYHTGREVPRYIFHIQSHSEIVLRLLELVRNYRRST